MLSRIGVALGLAALLIAAPVALDQAEARTGGHGSGGRSFGGVARGGHIAQFHGGHVRHFRHSRVFIAPVYGYTSYAYGNGCGWLYRQAVATGSGYWWRRYEACRDGYY